MNRRSFMASLFARAEARTNAITDWMMDGSILRPIVVFGAVLIAVAAAYGAFVLVRPCVGTGPSTCSVWCTGVAGDGSTYQYVCGEEECIVCTQREWRWNR